MPYPPREQRNDCVYHVWTRGTDGVWLFRDAEDRRRLLRFLGIVVAKFDWRCHMYCVLGTHYHLAVQTPSANISAGMQWLNGVYARTLNVRHGRFGHVVAERFNARPVETEEHAVELCRYVPLNPVEAGLCRTPQQWPWSSYAATLGLARVPAFLDPTWVLNWFGQDVRSARRLLHTWVMARAGGTIESPSTTSEVVEGGRASKAR